MQPLLNRISTVSRSQKSLHANSILQHDTEHFRLSNVDTVDQAERPFATSATTKHSRSHVEFPGGKKLDDRLLSAGLLSVCEPGRVKLVA